MSANSASAHSCEQGSIDLIESPASLFDSVCHTVESRIRLQRCQRLNLTRAEGQAVCLAQGSDLLAGEKKASPGLNRANESSVPPRQESKRQSNRDRNLSWLSPVRDARTMQMTRPSALTGILTTVPSPTGWARQTMWPSAQYQDNFRHNSISMHYPKEPIACFPIQVFDRPRENPPTKRARRVAPI